MNNPYVVKELISVDSGKKEFRTHYEYGAFPTYEAANERATATHNPNCFPQKDFRSLGSQLQYGKKIDCKEAPLKQQAAV